MTDLELREAVDELKVRINAAHALIKHGGAVMADEFLAKHGDELLAAARAYESPKLLVKDCTVLASEGRKGPVIIADDSEPQDTNYLRAKHGEIVGLFISDDPDRMLAAVRLAEVTQRMVAHLKLSTTNPFGHDGPKLAEVLTDHINAAAGRLDALLARYNGESQ